MLLLILVAGACHQPQLAPSDTGVTYEIVNQCGFAVDVQMKSGSDVITITEEATGTFRSLDEVPDETFLVTGPSGGQVEVSQGTARVQLVDEVCPVP